MIQDAFLLSCSCLAHWKGSIFSVSCLFVHSNFRVLFLQISDYTMLPDIATLSERLRVCLQEGDESPRDFTTLFDMSIYQLDTTALPKIIKLVTSFMFPKTMGWIQILLPAAGVRRQLLAVYPITLHPVKLCSRGLGTGRISRSHITHTHTHLIKSFLCTKEDLPFADSKVSVFFFFVLV